MHFEAQYNFLRIKPEHIKDLKNMLKVYTSIRFIHNPSYDKYNKYWLVSLGGATKDLNKFCSEMYYGKWAWEPSVEEKKSFWKRIFNNAK